MSNFNFTLGWKRPSLLAILILILLWLLVIYGSLQALTWYQSQQTQLSQQQLSQQIAAVAETMEADVQGWYTRMTNAEQLPDWPMVKTYCVLSELPTQPVADHCLPITFATLASLRQAEEQGRANVALIQSQAEENTTFILLAAKRPDDQMIMLALLPKAIDELTSRLDKRVGLWQLQQGRGQGQVIATVGNVQHQQASTAVTVPISGTHWQLSLWPASPVSTQWYGLGVIPVLLMITLLWWLLLKVTPKQRPKLTYKSKLLKTAPEMIDSFEPRRIPAWQRNELDENEESSDGVEQEKPKKKPETPLEMPVAAPKAAEAPIIVDPAIFKAYDIRGIVETQLTPAVVRLLGQAIANMAVGKNVRQLVVGRDGRLSSPALSEALIEGITESGCDVIDIGEVPTPVLYFACEHFKTRSGVMVTGSHNPANYNGLKMVIDGSVLTGEAIQTLKADVHEKRLQMSKGTAEKRNVTDDYLKAVVKDIQLARKLSVVIDCGNGVSGGLMPQLLRLLGCEVTELFCEVDGQFPNHHPNPSQPENMQDLSATVLSQKAELGLAFDGDGDRLGAVDGKGEIIWPDRLLILFAQSVLQHNPGARVIFDVKSTGLLSNRILQAGGKPTMSASGHSIIRNTMQRTGAKLAGEMSGHIFFADRWYGFDDGLYAACRLLELIAADEQQRDATAIFDTLPKRASTPEMLIEMDDAECRTFVHQFIDQTDFEQGQITLIDGIRVDFSNGWGLVRASNTVPGLSMRFEAATDSDLTQIKQLFKAKILKIKPSLKLPF